MFSSQSSVTFVMLISIYPFPSVLWKLTGEKKNRNFKQKHVQWLIMVVNRLKKGSVFFCTSI